MNALQAYTRDVRRLHKRFSVEEERALSERSKLGDRGAFDRLLYSILPMVIQLSSRYHNLGADRMDLIQAGNEGAIVAVRGFDPSLGRLTTFADRKIRQRMLYEIGAKTPIIRSPIPTRGERIWTSNRIRVKSLDVDNGNGATLAMFLKTRQTDPHADLVLRERDELDKDKIARLDDRHRTVIEMRLKGCTLNAIGSQLGVSKERTRQIETDAIQKLQEMYSQRTKHDKPAGI